MTAPTVPVSRLGVIAVGAWIGFLVGPWIAGVIEGAGMAMLGGIGAGSGWEDTGAGVLSALLGAFLAAAVTGHAARNHGELGGPRVDVRWGVVIVAVLAGLPFAVIGLTGRQARMNATDEKLGEIRRYGFEFFSTALELSRHGDRGHRALSALLLDQSAPGSARVAAGLALNGARKLSGDEEAALTALFREPSPVRLAALRLLAKETIQCDLCTTWITAALSDSDPAVRVAAIAVVSRYDSWPRRAGCDRIARLLHDPAAEVRAQAVSSSGCDTETADRASAIGLQDLSPVVRRQASLLAVASAYTPARRDAAIVVLTPFLRDPDVNVRIAVATSLIKLGSGAGGDVAARVLKGGDRGKSDELFQEAQRTLTAAWGVRATPVLATIQRCPSIRPRNRDAATRMLESVVGLPGAPVPSEVSDPDAIRRSLVPGYCP
jgi:hypothetical protein